LAYFFSHCGRLPYLPPRQEPALAFEKGETSTTISGAVVTIVTDSSLNNPISFPGAKENSRKGLLGMLENYITSGEVTGMKSMKGIERLISERWPKLKYRAENEKNPEKLIAILEEIDDLLFNLEMRIAAQNEMRSRDNSDSQSNCHESVRDVPPGDSESGSQ
jgi:hypothetical protein